MPVSITVVTPSFNQARYLEQTLRSVLAQRDQVHEYFVLDGGSTDGSVELIRRYGDKIDYWTSAKDAGQSDAIAKGFAHATGDVLFWLNSDDVLLPGALRWVRQAFDDHPDWDVLSGYNVRIDGDSRILGYYRVAPNNGTWARWGVQRVCQQTCFFKRKVYEQVGGLDARLHMVMDTELWYRLFRAGATWGHVPHFISGFRFHAQTKTNTWHKPLAEEQRMLHGRYPEYCQPCVRHKIGLYAYRLGHMLSGRYPLGRLQTLLHRGRPVTEIFGEWVVE